MMGTILVALDGSRHALTASRVAVELAARVGATLHGVHVRDQSLTRGSLLHDLSGALGLEPQLHLSGQIEQLLETQAEAILRAFEVMCAEHGVACRTSSPLGEIAHVLAELGELADLVLLGRRGASYDIQPIEASLHAMGRRLMSLSHTPLVFSGVEPVSLTRGLVGFDGSPGSCRALKDAARFCARLRLPLVVCHAVETDLGYLGHPLSDARQYLSPFGLELSFIEGEGGRVETLLEAQHQVHADILFVGYQGSSRVRELLTGHAPERLSRRMSGLLWVSR